MSEHFNLKLQYSDLNNEFFFQTMRFQSLKNKLKLPKNYALIQSTSKQSFTNNKGGK